MATKRLHDLLSHFTLRKSSGPTADKSAGANASLKGVPAFDDLPKFKEFSGCAWGVWGTDDQLGTVNLLTDSVVQRAAQEEIMYVIVI